MPQKIPGFGAEPQAAAKQRSFQPSHTIWMFVGNDRGGQTAATLYTVVASAKANEVEPWAYLRNVLITLADTSSRPESDGPSEADLHALLPDVWLTSHPEAHRSWSR